MIAKDLSSLADNMNALLSCELNVEWSIFGSQFGFQDWVDFATMQIRDRVLRVKLPDTPPSPLPATETKNWLKGWQSVLTSLGLLPPLADPRSLRLLRETKHHVCMIADTCAVAGGVISWLARNRWHRDLELIIPIVVDRELFGWADQDKFWTHDLNNWSKRVQYRLARRLSELPPKNLLVRRPPINEMAALMLAKVKLGPNEKSPDADLLLIDLARDYVRTQPPSASVFYVTGDLNHARTATAMLGASNVLYAPNNPAQINGLLGVCAFWHPSEGLGAVHCLNLADIAWDLMAATDKIKIIGQNVEFTVGQRLERNGCPYDWTSPIFDIEIVRDDRKTGSNYVIEVDSTQQDETLLHAPEPVQLAVGRLTGPAIGSVQNKLNIGIALGQIPINTKASERDNEASHLLVEIGAITPDGLVCTNSVLWPSIRDQEWDIVHQEFNRAPGYASAIERLRADASTHLTDREQRLLSIARRLGQIARLQQGGITRVGDRGLMRKDMIGFLEKCLSEPGRDYSLMDVLFQAMDDLSITPVRFERAMQRLMSSGYQGVTFETGGTVDIGFTEKIWSLEAGQIVDVHVGINAMYFGGDRPIRSLRRSE